MSTGTEQSNFPKGSLLGPYEITASIGAGGMGEVFRARDTRLNRDVAVKVLPKDFVADADRLRRFEQEAKTLAALNHPNVLTVFDAGVHEGAPYLVSELLEGKTLREEMNGGALPVRKATEYALQIAHGLAAAHGKGVIHRDLKPENIFVTKDGRVKILDFGLAKLRAPTPRPSPGGRERENDIAATIRIDADAIINTTEPGMLLGTPAYMSPEQVRGEPADHRADIFAFGAVLYEMLSGTRAFRRDTPIESMNAVLNDALPELSSSNPKIPVPLAHIVERCLEKNPENRFHSAKDLAFALAEISSSRSATPTEMRFEKSTWKRTALAGGAALVIILAGWLFLKYGSHSNSPNRATNLSIHSETKESVAVLPFVNLSADKADEYLSDGMTEELLNALAKVPGLRVPGRSSSFAFKGKTEQDIFRKVGEQLNVAAVLEGSVRKAGNQLRITAQLINAADGFHLWSETYDRDMTNIFAIQSDIAARVAEALKLQLLGAAASPKRPTDSIEAYKLYLQGRQLWNRRTGESLTQAISYFNQAIALDPAYALAYSALADCYTILEEYSGVAAGEAMPKARAAATRALALDSTLGEPHASLGHTKAFFDWDWAGAETELRRAIELNPNYATTFHWLAILLQSLGRFREALGHELHARELDPLSPVINVTVGQLLFQTGQEDVAIQLLQKQIALDPGFVVAHYELGKIYLLQGKIPEAILELETAHGLYSKDPFEWSLRGWAYARAGRREDAERILDRLLDLQRQGHSASAQIATVHHALTNDSQALDFLEKAASERSTSLPDLYASRLWKDLRPHPRAQAILRKMNLIK